MDYAGMQRKFAKIDFATSGAHTIVAAVAGYCIHVMGYYLVAGGIDNVKWRSATTDLTGYMNLAANGGVSAESVQGVLICAEGELLDLYTSAAVQVGGSVAYVMVPATDMISAASLQ